MFFEILLMASSMNDKQTKKKPSIHYIEYLVMLGVHFVVLDCKTIQGKEKQMVKRISTATYCSGKCIRLCFIGKSISCVKVAQSCKEDLQKSAILWNDLLQKAKHIIVKRAMFITDIRLNPDWTLTWTVQNNQLVKLGSY